MDFVQKYTVGDLAKLLGRELVGNPELPVLGINEIHCVREGDIVFVDHPKYYEKALHSNATIVLIDKIVDLPDGKALIISPEPFTDFNRLLKEFDPNPRGPFSTGRNDIHPSVEIAHGVFIGENVRIGENSIIHPGAYIGHGTVIGKNCVIGPNTSLGHAAFYYKKSLGQYTRMHTCGFVEIADEVEIGANSAIDAGVTSITKIGKGTKIDNLVQIGHDTELGENCLLASQVGIAGCCVIGDRVTFWGQSGCASGITVESDVTVLAQSGVGERLASGKSYFGSPCKESRQAFREMMAIKQLVNGK